MKGEIYKILMRLTLRLHNYSYRLCTKFAVKTEGGLHPKHRLMNYHGFFVDNITDGNTILDVGCGNGALTFDLAKKADRVTGIDISDKKIRIAQEKYSAQNIEYIIGDVTKYEFNQKFDVVVLSNILEHIENRVEFLKKVRCLAPKILIRVPLANRDWITLYKKELGVEWHLDKTHCVEYTLNTLKEELGRVNINLKKYSIQFGEIWSVCLRDNSH